MDRIGKTLSYYWRMLATSICFASFGLGAIFLSVTIMPMIAVCIRDQSKRKKYAQYIMHLILRFFVWVMRVSGVLTLKIQNPDKFSSIQNSLVIANHPTLIDVVIIISQFPAIDCIVKEDILRNPFLKKLVSFCGYIGNENPQELLESCVQCLKEGSSLIIFPEGTRTLPERKLHFQRGAANIAIRSQVPVVPIFIEYDGAGLRKGDRWYQVSRQARNNITLWVGEAIKIPSYTESSAIAARLLTEQLENFYIKELNALRVGN